ncbi:MAG: acetyl-CoA carboxylase biotin carboxyl carrier protein [Thermogutta sp.]|nr:acetyl-CoA carboxylase biotin carboxyl carrier protein [Thermogutta sp.]
MHSEPSEEAGGRSQSSGQDVFDVRRVRKLVELMERHELAEIDLRDGDVRIRLRKGRQPTPSPGASQGVPLPFVFPFSAPAVPPGGETAAPAPPARKEEDEKKPEAAPAPPADNLLLIRSPMVGTFYSAPDPDSPPYVKVGDHVGPETVVGIVEAMKVFNELPAEVSGKIVAVLVENGEPVEYGQPLFKVDPAV